jgi:hypothetical protein
MKLVSNWKRAHRMFTVQLGLVFTAWGALPAETQAAVLDLLGVPVNRVPAILGLAVIVGRVIAQASVQVRQP